MKKRLINLIENEDKRRPRTDDQLAVLLGTRRDAVTILRGELGIPDSRDRRKPILFSEIKDILFSNPETSNRQLTRIVKEKGFDVSRYLISQIREEIQQELSGNMSEHQMDDKKVSIVTEPEKKPKPSDDTGAFKRIIGFDGSLKPQIQQAKAAILYPPHGLHTLILGPTGVGKSNLAEAMYDYALDVEALSPNSPFIVFNCADYAENPQLLLSQLFGHTKGAYTGATEAKIGLVEKADGGILFLDEVHRLPNEGQELLYYLIDKGKFRRMGETEAERSANVMIIAATTEEIESSLLLTFRRRIPMIIELSSLTERPLEERYQIIRGFLYKEADRTGVKVKVNREALRALLVYDCPGNIGQLKSDIQVACAKGFLMYVASPNRWIEVDMIDLPLHVRRGLLSVGSRKSEVEYILKSDLIARPGQIEDKAGHKEDLYELPQEVYQYIEEKYQELELRGLEKEVINRIIGGELEAQFQQLIKRVEMTYQAFAFQDLESIVGSNIVEMTQKVVELAENRMGKIKKHLFYCLAIHLSATLERIRIGKPIVNPQLSKVIKEYGMEYSVAEEMVKCIEVLSGYEVPQDEIGFIAMYLRTITKPTNEKRGRVGVLVLSHGKVAEGMSEVANRLLGVNHAIGIEMPLDEKPESTLQRAIAAVKRLNEGRGVLLLVDMGSLITFGEIITKRTGIPTKTIARVDTVTVIDAVRKASLPDIGLDEIAASIDNCTAGVGRLLPFHVSNGRNDKKVILTICITGEGTAIKIKQLIIKLIPDIQEKAEIIPIGLMGHDDISVKLEQIKAKRNVVVIVGTIDPKLNSIPFIPLEEIMSGTGLKKLQYILNLETRVNMDEDKKTLKSPLSEVIYKDLIIINPNYHSKDEVLEGLANLLIDGGFVNERFLFDIYKREAVGSTLINKTVAIPHGNPENVVKQAVAICILKKPLIWWAEKEVEIVFMLALNKDSKEIIKDLYRIICDDDLLNSIKKIDSPADLRNATTEKLLGFN